MGCVWIRTLAIAPMGPCPRVLGLLRGCTMPGCSDSAVLSQYPVLVQLFVIPQADQAADCTHG